MTAPPQTLCCSGCKGRCSVLIEVFLNADEHDTKCGSLVIPQMVVGRKSLNQSTDPETCGTIINPKNWYQTIEIPVSATVDNIYDG